MADQEKEPLRQAPYQASRLEATPRAPVAADLSRPWDRIGSEIGWGTVLVGLAGSIALVLAAPLLLVHVEGPQSSWWYELTVPPKAAELGNYAVAYAGMGALVAAWISVARRLRSPSGLRLRDLWVVAGLWTLPLLVGPPLFSGDIYSYLAQGMLTRLNLDPYQTSPLWLPVVGVYHMAGAVAPVWRTTTAPYGPLFLWMASLLVGVTGSHLATGAMLMRLPELAGVALTAACLPPLARRLGAEPRQAMWIGAASPLVLFELVAAGHNDALMVGLMAFGLLLALEQRPLAAVFVCALATLVKAPAAMAAVFVAWTWARTLGGRSARLRALLLASAVALGTAFGVSLATGLGFQWISPQLITTPSKASISITPSTAFSHTIDMAASLLGVSGVSGYVDGLARATGFLLAAAISLFALVRARLETLVPLLGAAFLAVVIFGPVLWPWYLTWGVALLAAWPAAQRHRALVLGAGCFVFVLTPAGQLILPSLLSPLTAVAWTVAGLWAWRAWRRAGGHWRSSPTAQAA